MLRSGEWCAENRKLMPFSPPSAQDTRSDSIDITHTAITLNLTNPPQISASCLISITPKVAGVPEIRLDLEGLTVNSVALDGAPLTFTHTGTELKVFFPAPLAPGSDAQLKIDYHGIPTGDASGWGGVYQQGNYFFNLGVGFAADPHSFGRAWFPCFDNFVERSTFEFAVITSKSNPAYCNGLLINEMESPPGIITRFWELDQPVPSYLACFASGPYISWKRIYDSIPVEIACAAADSNKVAATFQHLPQALACYQHWFGPYKWPKIGYSLVPFGSGAMEHATNVAIGQPFINGTLSFETLWAHELSHHWWGDLATCSSAEDMWLNEGWAAFSEHLFTEWVYGQQAYRDEVQANFLNVLENAHVDEGGYRAVSGLPHDLTYGAHVYNKGAVVAHNLRGYLGDSLFRKGVREALDATSFDDWSSAGLRDELNAATGEDLTDFFDDWVFSPGFPHFSVDSFQIEPPAIDTYNFVRVYVKQKLRGAPHFYQNVPLEFTFVDKNWQRQTRMAVVDGENSVVEFLIPLPFVPEFVWLNTNLKLTLARAERERVVKTTGNQSFNPAKMSINATSVPDSALIRVEHHYVMPDTGGTANPNGYALTNRYWTIEGDLPAGFDAGATVFYDGRGQSDQLDTELFAQTGSSEDSIILLYRPSPGHPWSEHPDYTKNTLTANADKYGFLRFEHVLPGQYTIAKGATTIAAQELPFQSATAFAMPNPASDYVKIKAEVLFDKVVIFNDLGEILRELSMPPANTVEIQTAGFPAGRYWFLMDVQNGSTLCVPVIIANQ